MILFQLTLSPAQINVLRFIAAGNYTAGETQPPSDQNYDQASHFMSTAPKLQREGLLAWFGTGNHSPAYKHLPAGGPHWEVTRKGRLVLEIIALEVDAMRALLPDVKAIPAPKKKVKR